MPRRVDPRRPWANPGLPVRTSRPIRPASRFVGPNMILPRETASLLDRPQASDAPITRLTRPPPPRKRRMTTQRRTLLLSLMPLIAAGCAGRHRRREAESTVRRFAAALDDAKDA